MFEQLVELCCRERFVNVRCAFEWLLALLYADAVLAFGGDGSESSDSKEMARLLAVLVSRLELHVGDDRPGSTCSVLTVLLQISKVRASCAFSPSGESLLGKFL